MDIRSAPALDGTAFRPGRQLTFTATASNPRWEVGNRYSGRPEIGLGAAPPQRRFEP
ncbi:hypothetical protein HAT86_05185 [Roseovarius gahaiensis]|uniref:Uncharacterized protein n=1 Tax=Roseovarius gahaiensis TaxID=2716691 RepID=A0A967B9K2_9RHOB|nr:hypothetical protein [Roseovarius gahaiensis]NHQ73860.1 hypothetical protein [Roseovarius gahaiensis]